jgi:AcrR family transcriptional regulator
MQTRARLLDAAAEVFAASGFRDATVAEICRRAGANVAAVNYHFGGKEKLYVEAWRHSFERSLQAYPYDADVPEGASPEQRLRGFVRSIMKRMRDPRSCEFEIIHKEMANPTGLLGGVMREGIGPIQRGFVEVIREVLGKGASQEEVNLCQMSVRAQCFGPMLHERFRKRAGADWEPGPAPMEMDVEVLAEHIVRFSLAGIEAVRARRERGGKKR